jgi:dihydrolipoamide dehydrogenase
MSEYDIAVIGAGPGGYVAAIRCAQLGLKTVCIDKWIGTDGKPSLGGTCLNVGCIPSKALLDSSHLYESISKEASVHGINSKASLDLAKMQGRKKTIINNLAGGIAGLFKKNGVESIAGTARLTSSQSIEITAPDSSTRCIAAKNIIIATGSVPIDIPQAKVEDSIVDNAGALGFDELPVDLGIIGAGVIGLELGSVWRRLGSKVTLLEMCDEFLPTVDHEIAALALKIFKSQGLNILLGAKVTETENDEDYVSVTYAQDAGEHEAEFDRLVVAVGRRPNTDGLGLDDLDINVDARGFVITDDECQTNIEHVYAIGDVSSGPMLAHRASKDGIIVAENIAAGSHKKTHYEQIPWVIYTWPEIAWFGKTEQELDASGTPCKVGTFPFMASGRAHAMNSPQGMVKIIAAQDDTILGMHIIGPNASELIASGVSAAANKHTYKTIIEEIHAHPTLSEAMHEAALDIENRAIHF